MSPVPTPNSRVRPCAWLHTHSRLCLIVNFHLSRRSDLLVGYSHMWTGNFLEQTGPGIDPDPLESRQIVRPQRE